MSNAPSICVEHLSIASPHRTCHVRTDVRTNEHPLTVSNTLPGRLAHAGTANRRFAVPIVEIHSPEIGLSTGLWGVL